MGAQDLDDADLGIDEILKGLSGGVASDVKTNDPRFDWRGHHRQTAKQALSQLVSEIIGEDEKGETVQAPCPDLEPGCAVYHTEFRMTHKVKARNEVRSQQRERARQKGFDLK